MLHGGTIYFISFLSFAIFLESVKLIDFLFGFAGSFSPNVLCMFFLSGVSSYMKMHK